MEDEVYFIVDSLFYRNFKDDGLVIRKDVEECVKRGTGTGVIS